MVRTVRGEFVTCGMKSTHGRRRRIALRVPVLRFVDRVKFK